MASYKEDQRRTLLAFLTDWERQQYTDLETELASLALGENPVRRCHILRIMKAYVGISAARHKAHVARHLERNKAK